ncbi:MAG: serine/threonine-protein kinase [Thermoanaerobaculia bacterium]|nr:serine/threonine-protein kinase [Thermoanaerobaculia bacterium]
MTELRSETATPAADGLFESVVERISEGLEVDWSALEQQHPELTERWQGLRQVQEISDAFRLVAGQPVESTASGSEREASDPKLRWGSLQLLEKIGEGSFAEVFRAHDPMLERDVALKLARGEHALQHRRFLDEGRLLAQIDHPGVVRVHGAAVHDGRAGVWMDLAIGRSLSQRLEDDGRFAEYEVRDVAQQLTSALAAVHAVGLVHGDIKAANVLRRDGGVLVLGDFGSSLDLRRRVEGSGSARPHSATPLNAAPEILRGEPADPRSDLFSLGVLLYQLLTGTFPFTGDSLEAIRDSHENSTPKPLRERCPDISPELAEVVDRAIAVDPDRRWQSARELGDALAGFGVQSTRTTEHRRIPPSWAGVAMAFVLAIVLISIGLYSAAGPSTRDAGRANDVEFGTSTIDRAAAGASFAGVMAPDDPLRVGLFRSGRDDALQPGDALVLGDALHLRIRENQHPLWLYLVNEDSRGSAYTLFPLPGAEPANPLPQGELRLPGQLSGVAQNWVVTSEGQTESFLLVASRWPLPKLEEALAEIAAPSAGRGPGGPASSGLLTRGVGGVGPAVDAGDPGVLLTLRDIVLAESSTRKPPEEEGAARVGDQTPNGSKPLVEILTLRGAGGHDP